MMLPFNVTDIHDLITKLPMISLLDFCLFQAYLAIKNTFRFLYFCTDEAEGHIYLTLSFRSSAAEWKMRKSKSHDLKHDVEVAIKLK